VGTGRLELTSWLVSRADIINNLLMLETRRPSRAYDRLSTPLVRDRGALRPARWDEALDRAAAGFRRNIDVHGSNALGIFSCSKSTNEVNFMAQKIARVAFGTNNIDSCNRT
jgi:predicted molibdopterin-dependent oxidoreductase YjgC